MKKIIFLLLFSIYLTAHSQDNALTVSGNNNGTPVQMSLAELKTVFLGEKAKWANGQKVIIALMKLNTPAGKLTCDKLYKMTPDQVTKHWLTVSIKGTMDAPVFFNTAVELRNFVSLTPGAIGITNETTAAPSTRTILIDGKKNF